MFQPQQTTTFTHTTNMKSEKQKIPETPIEYPILMEYRDNTFVVLFSCPRSGLVVHSSDKTYAAGHYYDSWNYASGDSWHPFQGSIVLSN